MDVPLQFAADLDQKGGEEIVLDVFSPRSMGMYSCRDHL